ncbi:unnamed protein product [Rhizoctonia solani]|uniref:Uncharacterized protein n=1 Tax=Rhizoctonia solani TaxID=456999 RepID=A0A8H3BRR8_9AGAM|nr:unnamed protein product [Rhizoctonia solani]
MGPLTAHADYICVVAFSPNDDHTDTPIITYDREVNAPVLQDPRVWIAGLSDEGGAGAWLAAEMKNAFLPVPTEIAKIECFVNETLWGNLQYSSGSNMYGVKKSVFFYQPAKPPNYQYNTSIDTINSILGYMLTAPHWAWNGNARRFAFGGTFISSTSIFVSVIPSDTFRRRVYITSLGALFTLDAGSFDSVKYSIPDQSVTLNIIPSVGGSGACAENGRLLMSQPAVVSGLGTLAPSRSYSMDAGAYVVPFSDGTASVIVCSI